MSLESRLRHLEERTPKANPEPGQQYRTITPDSPQWDEVMTALILCGAVTVTPRQVGQDEPSSA